MELASACSESSLPNGWTVQVSKTYPDHVYYFNTITGVSSWTLPDSAICSSDGARSDKSKPGCSKKSKKRKKDKTDVSGSKEQRANQHRKQEQQKHTAVAPKSASRSQSKPSTGACAKKAEQSVDKCAHQKISSKKCLLLAHIDQDSKDGRQPADRISSALAGDVDFCLGLSELGHTVCLKAEASRKRHLSRSSCRSAVLSGKPIAAPHGDCVLVEDNWIKTESKQRKQHKQQIHLCQSAAGDKAHASLHFQPDGKKYSEDIVSKVCKTRKTNIAVPSQKEFDLIKPLKKRHKKKSKKLPSSGVKTLLCSADSVKRGEPLCLADSTLTNKQGQNTVCTHTDVHDVISPKTTDSGSYFVGEEQCQQLATQTSDITTSLSPSTDHYLPAGSLSTQASQHEKIMYTCSSQANASSLSIDGNKMDGEYNFLNARTSFTRDDAQLGLSVLGSSHHDAAYMDYMEVDLIDEDNDAVMVDIQEIQEHIRTFSPQSNQPVGMLTQTVQNISMTPASTPSVSLLDREVSTVQNLFIVLDTNVLIKSLDLVKKLQDLSIKDWGLSQLVIPWVVLQELDSLKGNKYKLPLVKSIQHDAQQAVRYLHSCLVSGHPRVRWQTPAEASQMCLGSQFVIENNDDRVINCGLQYQQKYPHSMILLLTEDINLQNKTMVIGLNCSDVKSLFKKLTDMAKENHSASLHHLPAVPNTVNQNHLFAEPSVTSNINKIQDERAQVDEIVCSIKAVLCDCLNPVIEADMKEAYGDLWLDVAYKKPPWSADDLLCLLCKHWMAVFGIKLPKTLKAVAEDLSKKLRAGQANQTRLTQVQDTIKSCLELVGALQSNKSYAAVAQQAQVLLTKLYEKTKVCWGLPTQKSGNNSCITEQSLSQPSPSNSNRERNCIRELETKVPKTHKEKATLFISSRMSETVSQSLEEQDKVMPSEVSQADNRILAKDNSQKAKITALQSLPSSSEKKGAVGKLGSRIQQDITSLHSPGNDEAVWQESAAKWPPKPQVQILAENIDMTQTVMDRFQAVWSTINNCCCMAEEAVKRDLSPDEKSDIKEILLNLIPFLRQLHTQFAQCLSFSPLGLEKKTFAFHQFCHLLNNFFIHAHVPAPDVPDATASQMIALMSQGKSRMTLSGGLSQLQEFITRVDDIVSCL